MSITSPVTQPEPEEVSRAQSALFTEVFGIPEDALQSRGVDPGQYAREHVREVLKDESKAKLLLPESTRLMKRSLASGLNVYKALSPVSSS